MDLRRFGELVNEARQRAGLTQQGLADEMSNLLSLLVSQQSVANWCRGRNLPADRTTLLALCQALYQAGGLTSLEEMNEVLFAAEAGALHQREVEERFAALVGTESLLSSEDDVALSVQEESQEESQVVSRAVGLLRANQDWIEAPDASIFYGRREENATLERWILTERCRLVGILGIGDLGKTALATRLGEQIKEQFEYAIWCSLLNAPPIEYILARCIQLLSDHQRRDLPDSLDEAISLLLTYLHQHRSLIILDNAESILREGDKLAGHYRLGYEGYGQLLRRIGETAHQSCVVLTSREKPKEFALLEGRRSLVRSYSLHGLGAWAGRALLEDKSLSASTRDWQRLIEVYSGNPFMLKIVADSIRTLFGGDVTAFLQTNESILGDVNALLEQQVGRLSALEQKLMYWLAIEREPVSPNVLLQNAVEPISMRELLVALESLKRRSLIESTATGFTMQNVATEYMTDRLIERLRLELESGELTLFNSHALIKSQSKDYVRQSQIRIILAIVADRLVKRYRSPHRVAVRLMELLSNEPASSSEIGYKAGNVINLLAYLKCDLRGYNFASFSVWQAYLRGVELQGVNFSYADLTGSVFTEAFGVIVSVAFSPNGRLLAAGTASGEIRLWDVESDQLLALYKGHTNWVWGLAFSPDNRLLASGASDYTLRLWDIHTGQCFFILEEHTGRVFAVDFSPDGRLLASGSGDHTIRLWDVYTGDSLGLLEGHSDRIWSLAFSPDGRLLASASDDHTVRLWDVDRGECTTVLQKHLGWVKALAFSHDGQLLASGGDDRVVRLWHVPTAQQIKTLRGHAERIRSLAFNPDGHRLISGSDDHTIRLWDIQKGQSIKILEKHTNQIRDARFSPDGKTFVSGGEDRTLLLWETDRGECIKTIAGYTNLIWSVAFSPDGKMLASSSDDCAVRLWDVGTGECLQVLKEHTNWVRAVAFSPDGQLIASGSVDKTVRLWDAETGRSLNTLRRHRVWIRDVAFSPDGSILASSGDDRTIRLWNVYTGQSLRTLTEHTRTVYSVAFSPCGELLASGSDDWTVRLWNVQTGECLQVLQEHTSWVKSIAFSPDGNTLLSGSDDKTIRLWDMNNHQCLKIFRGHSKRIRSVAYHPDGEIIASGSDDQSVRLWDSKSGECLKVLRGHTKRVRGIAFSPDGQTVASCGDDETIRFWSLPDGRLLRTLRSARPYEGMIITGATGITEAQKMALKTLGAVEE